MYYIKEFSSALILELIPSIYFYAENHTFLIVKSKMAIAQIIPFRARLINYLFHIIK